MSGGSNGWRGWVPSLTWSSRRDRFHSAVLAFPMPASYLCPGAMQWCALWFALHGAREVETWGAIQHNGSPPFPPKHTYSAFMATPPSPLPLPLSDNLLCHVSKASNFTSHGGNMFLVFFSGNNGKNRISGGERGAGKRGGDGVLQTVPGVRAWCG